MKPFSHSRRVSYFETDAMGVVHHSNHIRYFEDARVAWLRERGVLNCHAPYGPLTFAVLRAEACYLKPARFDDELEVRLQARQVGARIQIQYAIWCVRLQAYVATGETDLVPLSDQFRAVRVPPAVADVLAREPWNETWPTV